MIRTLVVEDNGLARLGLRAMLDRHASMLEIDEAPSGADLAFRLAARYYELIIVEPALAGGADLALVKRLREAAPWAPVLVFTELDELTHGVDAIRNGAKGYLMKTASRDEFGAAVKRVAAGQIYLSKALAAEFSIHMRKYDARKQPHETFSTREFQVFAMAVCGMTTAESAHVLQMSAETAGALKRGVMARLNASTPQRLAEYAAAHDLMRECSRTASTLWSGRYAQEGIDRPAVDAASTSRSARARHDAAHAGRSPAIIGRAMP